MSLNYSVMARSAEDFLTFQKSPSIHLWPCSKMGASINLLGHISGASPASVCQTGTGDAISR
jgi:hypothetical protein